MIIEEGVAAWNSWRQDNPEVIPDLSRADLNRANLQQANLKGADLQEVNLRGAFLEGANLKEGNLRGADFRQAYIQEANLEGANLKEANFRGAFLHEANFSNTIAGYTAFIEVDLSTVKGLETVIHVLPSSIGIDTLYESKGDIPKVFLFGCGVPDQMIEYARSLTESPIRFYSCFISYSYLDEEFAKHLWEGLQANCVRCWYAPHDMKINDKILPVIDDMIRVHDKLLLILSKHSVHSDWVEHEVKQALVIEKERKESILFPVRLDEAVMDSDADWVANIKKKRHIGNFTRWKDHDAYSASFEQLLLDLEAG
ncbi:MAG: toll/interleukin-1 receptor domain-containing protein [Chlorobium sp.]|nr:MAG: toll/interleukin-1 receptor domain-containing protein [Chlorobium sp.]